MTQILFQNEINGYDKIQVDNYITKLSKAYQDAYDENQSMRSNYDTLREAYERMEAQMQTKWNSKVITKTIMNMESLAQKIIDDANEEAERVKTEALLSIDTAQSQATELEAKVRQLADDAATEKANAENEAKKILDKANIEAVRILAQAKSNLAEAQEIIQQMLSKVQSLLTFETPRF